MTSQELLDSDPKLAELVRRLVAAQRPARIYLFGSRARDASSPSSDYDLVLLFERLDAPAYRVAQDAHSLVWGLGISADILVWTLADFERRLSLAASLAASVARDGTLLHAA